MQTSTKAKKPLTRQEKVHLRRVWTTDCPKNYWQCQQSQLAGIELGRQWNEVKPCIGLVHEKCRQVLLEVSLGIWACAPQSTTRSCKIARLYRAVSRAPRKVWLIVIHWCARRQVSQAFFATRHDAPPETRPISRAKNISCGALQTRHGDGQGDHKNTERSHILEPQR